MRFTTIEASRYRPIETSGVEIEIFFVEYSVSRRRLLMIPAVTPSIFSTREDPVATTRGEADGLS